MFTSRGFKLPNWVAIAFPVSIIVFSIILAQSHGLQLDPKLAMGITYDLTLVAPLLYLAVIWGKPIPKITVVPVFIIGLITAFQILPEGQLQHAKWLEQFVLPLVELTVISVVGYKVFVGIKAYRKLKSDDQPDVFHLLQQAAIQVVGQERVAKVLATEMGMLYYGLFAWKKRAVPAHSFTSYKDNGSTAILGVIIFLVVVETVVLHIVLLPWQPIVAWIIFALSLYTGLQLLAHGKALRQRFTRLDGEGLYIKYGLAAEVHISLETIQEVILTTNDIDERGGKLQKIALLGDLEPHNVVLYLNEPVYIQKLYGMQRKGDVIACYIDNPEAFLQQLSGKLA